MLHNTSSAFQPIRVDRQTAHHPGLFYLLLIVGLPLGILAAVFLTSFVIMGPIALLLGWI